MSQNPYTPPEIESEHLPEAIAEGSVHSRVLFLLTSFLLSMIAFYLGLAVNVFSTPYLEPHIGIPMFAGYMSFAMVFSGVCTAAVALLSLTLSRISGMHYALLTLPFLIEFGMSWFFFVAFFGI